MQEYRVFLGNPGAGKSTLINCIFGRAVCHSGLSFGEGKTVMHQEYIADDGIVYVDTPGLADICIRKQAAKEIQEALSKGGKYKLFFVTELRNGRVSVEDITTFNQVVRAIDVPNLEFSVIVNKISRKHLKILSENKQAFDNVFRTVNSMDVTTTSITFMPKFEDLVEEDDAFVKLPDHFMSFLNHAPSVHILRENVRNFDVDGDQRFLQFASIQRKMVKVHEDNCTVRTQIQQIERRQLGFVKSMSRVFNALCRLIRSYF